MTARKKTTMKKVTLTKSVTKDVPLEFSKKIINMKGTFLHKLFVTCAQNGGKIKADKETADTKFEISSKKNIRKAGLKLVKKGLFNVNDGIFSLSKDGHSQIIHKKIVKKKK